MSCLGNEASGAAFERRGSSCEDPHPVLCHIRHFRSMPLSRIFMGGIATETNSFSAVPTVLSDFQNGGIYRGDATQHPAAHFTAPLHCWRARASAAGHVVIEGLMAAAQPGGITTAKTWELLRNDLLESLRQAGDVDLILLNLHGGMIADGEFDCEGALLEDMRRMAPKAVIGCELDPHCHLTDRMVHNADVIVTYKAYPHTDIVDVAEDVWRLSVATLAGTIRPVAACADKRNLGCLPCRLFLVVMARDVLGVGATSVDSCLLIGKVDFTSIG